MALLIGTLVALGVGLLGTVVGLDRDRAYYPAVTIATAFYYVLFAVMGGSPHALVLEFLVAATFLAAAIVGFRSSLWVVVTALAAHGVFDLVHGGIIANPGMPAWWPDFCLTFDVAAAAYLAWRLRSGRVGAAASGAEPARAR